MKRYLIVIAGIMVLALSVIGTKTFANKQEDVNDYNFKILYEEKYVLDEMVNKDYNVIVKYNGQVLEDIVTSKDMTINIETLEIPDNETISHWEITGNEQSYIITPVIIENSDVNISFAITNGGKLVDEVISPSITKSVEYGTKLKEVLPEVQIEEGFYFAGWFTLEDVENEIEIAGDEREDIKELYSQIKEKEEDLSKEKSKEKKSDIKQDIKELNKNIKQKKEEKKFKKEIVSEYQFINNVDSRLIYTDREYIAVVYPDINNNKKDDRKEKLNVSIDFGLDNEVHEQEMHVGQTIKLPKPSHEDNVFIDWFSDNEYKEIFVQDTILTKDISVFAQWKTPKEVIDGSGSDLIFDERISNKIEVYLNEENKNIYEENKKESEKKEKELEEKNEEGFQYTEKKHTLRNFNLEQTYLIKFNNNETFLFSVALPYGRTLELLNENGQKVKELGIRQEATIDLQDLINNNDSLDFDIKTIKKNNAVITQIYTKNNKKEID